LSARGGVGCVWKFYYMVVLFRFLLIEENKEPFSTNEKKTKYGVNLTPIARKRLVVVDRLLLFFETVDAKKRRGVCVCCV